jgi:4-cresol dehydrogenase (hydroxylating) flavoprotein subunit
MSSASTTKMPTSARADACYRKMSEEIGARGMFVGRAPVDYRDLRMRRAMPAFRDACAGIKVALAPNGVTAPGRYGISTP